MPTTNFERKIFALITVLITVNAFVFYNLYIVNGTSFITIAGENSVLSAINSLGGIYTLGTYLPIIIVIAIEFFCAYTLEILIGSPMSFKLASKSLDVKTVNPIIFETTIICITVALMCPMMSFLASILYYPYNEGFNVLTLIGNWLKLVCYNLPFAFFTQILFIQPLVRKTFKTIFRKEKLA